MFEQPLMLDLNDELPGAITGWQLIMAVLTLVIGFILVTIICSLFKKSMLKAKTGEILAEFVTRLARLLLQVFVLATALGMLGLDIGPAVISLSVVMGFVLGFALGDTLSNIAAGFMIAVTKPFDIGDYVELNGVQGAVEVVGISTTEMNTPDNKHIVIPNKSAWGANIVNYTKNDTRRVDMAAGVSYSDNLNKVIEVTLKVLKADTRVLADPAPQVAVKEMADSAVVFVVRPWVKTADYWNVFFDTQKALKEAYDENDISIPFPQMDVHMEK